MKRDYPIYLVDAFTDQPFLGNPAGVVLMDYTLNEEEMQKIAAEVNVSETAFIENIDREEYRVRFFTPVEEVELCGHATIASFYTLAKLGYIEALKNGTKKVYQHTKAGKLAVMLRYVNETIMEVTMEQSSPKHFGPVKNIPLLAKAMGISEDSIEVEGENVVPELVSTGLKDMMVPVKNRSILSSITLDREATIELSKQEDAISIHAFTQEDGIWYQRNFAPIVAIDEEAATGTSTGAMLYYLLKNNLITNREIIAHQGLEMNRPSRIVAMASEEEVPEITVGGKLVLSLKVLSMCKKEKALKDYTVKDFVEKATDRTSIPGGGAVSALGGALASALTNMVGNLSIQKHATEEEKNLWGKPMKDLYDLGDQLLELMEKDAHAFDAVIQAMKLSKDTEEKKIIRERELERAYEYAIEVPLQVAEKALEILKLQEFFAVNGSNYGISDVGVAALFAYSALEGALFNVRINLGSIPSKEKGREYEEKQAFLLDKGNLCKEKVLEIVYGRLS